MTCSGKFVLRLDPEFHERLRRYARQEGKSLNGGCIDLLERGFSARATLPAWKRIVREVLPQIREKFRNGLLGVVAFGSQPRGETTDESDLDLLIVLSNDLPIDRSLYRWWDDEVRWNGDIVEVNPHFSHLPADPSAAGGLWLEIACEGEVILRRGQALKKLLDGIRQWIEEGRVKRAFSSGQPYWVWSDR